MEGKSPIRLYAEVVPQRNVADLTAEQKVRFDAWWKSKRFEVEDEIAHRLWDAAYELLEAASDSLKLKRLDPSAPPAEQLIPEAVDWVIGLVFPDYVRWSLQIHEWRGTEGRFDSPLPSAPVSYDSERPKADKSKH